MDITYTTTKDGVNWNEVADILNTAGLSDYDARYQEIIFKNSFAVVLAYVDGRIVGVGRALSDGVCQAVLYNIAVREKYQGYGIGGAIIEKLLETVKGQSVILYTHPRTVALYEKYGFRRSKTGMCMYAGSKEKLEHMKESGFILPEGFRFVDEYEREDMQ